MLSWRLIRRLLLPCLAAVLIAAGFVLAGAHDGVLSPSAAQAPSQAAPPPPKVKTQSTVVPAVAKVPVKQGNKTIVAKLDRMSTKNFGTVGVTWSAATKETDVTVRLRTRSNGTWSAWQQLDLDDLSAGGRPGTEPIWVGRADGVAVEVETASGKAPADIKVLTIDAGKSSTSQVSPAVYHPTAGVDGTVQEAATTTSPPQPTIILRAAWGARKPTPCDSPRTAARTKGAVIHHTAGSNNYTKADSAAIVRGDQAYHMDGHGWCDIGYNFVVDKYGQIFEGRDGGITKQVRAAHSGNDEVNTYAMGVALAGTFSTVEPGDAMKDAVVRLVAWRFGQMGLKAKGTWHVNETLKGTHDGLDAHTLNLIAGHRNVVGTECPGAKAYAWLSAKGGLRDRVETALAQNTQSSAVGEVGGRTVSNISYTRFDLAWRAFSGAKSYQVYASTSSTAPIECSSSCTAVKSGLTFQARGLSKSKKYYVWVRALNSSGRAISAWEVTPKTVQLKVDPVGAGDSITVPSSGKIPLTGRGFGHGIGMSQYGAQGAAGDGLTFDKILAFYYPGTTLGKKTGDIRVQISKNTGSTVEVLAHTGLVLHRVDSGSNTSLPMTIGGKAVDRWRILPNSSKKTQSTLQYRTSGVWHSFNKRWTADAQFEGPISQTLVLPGGTLVKYRGAMRSALPKSGATTRVAVNVLPIDSYVRGVVAAEMPSSWKYEALKAQAVAARTYGVRSMSSSRYYDICDTTSCQVYGGAARETSATDKAISATAGKILTYDGKPALTQFSSSSGGYTVAGSEPYLKAISDPYDGLADNPHHVWTTTLTAQAVQKAYSSIGTLTKISITKRDGHGTWGGRVTSLTLVGSKKSLTISGTAARSAFGLQSTWFSF
jgi:SpoIID/LytB domain protein